MFSVLSYYKKFELWKVLPAKKAGITAAVNDIGIMFLPNGQHFFISIFVTDSKEDADTNEKIISDIVKSAWDYFKSKAK